MKRITMTVVFGCALCSPTALAQRSVKLTWQPSPDAGSNPSLGYNVYRASACAGQFSKLNSSVISGTTYFDTAVATGAAYCYQVTAVLSGVESAPSNRVVAVVPPPSNRQETCDHRGSLIAWIRCVGSRPKKPTP
ncbi:MAG TPA: fibronectin type III domain-containing protein [Verrucomicrobiae bacterium]|nr:fibronectin type III domain-containing protein [Verrucomicrobiae bacterium]